MMMNFLYNKTN